MKHLGDFRLGQTVRIPFNTIDPTTGAPAAITGATGIAIRDGNTANSFAVTIATNVGGVTGSHIASIDTSNATNFPARSDFAVRLTAGTVGGISVAGAWIGTFTMAELYHSNANVPANAVQWNGVTIADPLQSAVDVAGAVLNAANASYNASGSVGANILAGASSGGGGGLDAAGVRAAIGLANANLDAQLDAIPNNTEFNARTIASASYATASALGTISTTVGAIQTATSAISAAIAALNNLSSQGVVNALGAYDAATGSDIAPVASLIAEMDAVLDKLNVMIQSPATGQFRFTAQALELGPVGSGGGGGGGITVEQFEARTLLREEYATAQTLATANTAVTAIKAKTDQLEFEASSSAGSMVKSSLKKVGNTVLQQGGTGGQNYGA